MWLGLKKDGERLSCIKDCERYLVLIIVANYGTALRQRRVREPIIRERRAYSIE